MAKAVVVTDKGRGEQRFLLALSEEDMRYLWYLSYTGESGLFLPTNRPNEGVRLAQVIEELMPDVKSYEPDYRLMGIEMSAVFRVDD
jgi:hypothetical protein